jgi:hypothetical protein
MKFYRAGLIEFLIFLAAIAVLTTLHSRRLDNALAIGWVLVLAAASVRLIYKWWHVRNDPDALRHMNASRWSAVLPPRVMRWMMGDSGKDKSE